ncbi:MAG: tetratricopeptide repeat protein [Acidobacteriota bacterium]
MKNKRRFGLFFVAGTILAISAIADGQGYGARNRPASGGGSKIISGKVWMPDGTPAVGEKVSISSSDVNTTTLTDADGTYSFGSLPGGTYTVSVKIEGLLTASESYTIDEDTGSANTISLPLYLRNPGQKKGDFATGPLFKDVPKTAVDDYRKAVEKLHTNDAIGAIAILDQSIAEYPEFAAAYYQRGSAYIKINDLDKALESFVKAISIKSDYLEAKYSVGYVQYLKNNFEVAAAVFDDVVKQKEMPEAHLYLAISLAKLHNVDAAVPHFKAAIAAKDDVSMALAHRYLGGIYIQKKQNAAAAAELEKYLKLAPKAPDADKLRSTIADLRKSS